eukprot:m.216794 g.216794  ORF g.216794 m.216794 type:complete len:116 (-) comp16984_c1_seq45:250-597(-)
MAEVIRKPCNWFESKYGLCGATLRLWHNQGKITNVIRMPGGKRLYAVQEIEAILGCEKTTSSSPEHRRQRIIYQAHFTFATRDLYSFWLQAASISLVRACFNALKKAYSRQDDTY